MIQKKCGQKHIILTFSLEENVANRTENMGLNHNSIQKVDAGYGR